MNCKQGDLAFHMGGEFGSKSPNLGKVVKCVRLLGRVPGWCGMRWEVEGALLVGAKGSVVSHADDAYLRPIRPGDGADETLTWAGKPQPVTA